MRIMTHVLCFLAGFVVSVLAAKGVHEKDPAVFSCPETGTVDLTTYVGIWENPTLSFWIRQEETHGQESQASGRE